EAEDLLQETFVRAFRFFHRYDENMPFTSWLYRIMLNIHIDGMRRKSKLKVVSMDQASTEGGKTWDFADERAVADLSLMEGTLEEPFQLGLKAMSPDFRMAVVLADIEGMSYEEIAEIMDSSVGTVRSRIHRGRKQLREYLVRSWPEKYEVKR
nr:sigma-70 family RNA polymerase sigma factor [Fimbriimonadaceae bacterium]